MRLIGLTTIALLGAGAALAGAAKPARLVDQWSGIVFFCSPDLKQAWTIGSCAAITEDFVARTTAAGIKVAVLAASSAPQWMAKAAAAGFDGGNALSVVFGFKGGGAPGVATSLDLLGQFPVDPKPGIEPETFRSFVMQTTTIDPGEHPGEAVDAAAAVWSGVLAYLAGPMPAP